MSREPRALYDGPVLRHVFLPVFALCVALSSCTLKDDTVPGTPGDLPAPPDVAAAPADAHVTPSGLASKMLRVGVGSARPTRMSIARVHYTGWTTDGLMIDSSVKRGQPSEFRLTEVIAGWTEGLQLMVVGEKRRFWVPAKLAYEGMPGRPQGMLVFDVELLGVK